MTQRSFLEKNTPFMINFPKMNQLLKVLDNLTYSYNRVNNLEHIQVYTTCSLQLVQYYFIQNDLTFARTNVQCWLMNISQYCACNY